jgi:hypothetical protein
VEIPWSYHFIKMAKFILYPWADEDFADAALSYGNPIPTHGQCENLRQQMEDKAAVASKKSTGNKKHFSIGTDGKNVYLFESNIESLVFAFQKKHDYVPKLPDKFPLIKSYENTLASLMEASWQLQVGYVGVSRQSAEIGPDYERNPIIAERRKKQIQTLQIIIDELGQELRNLAQEIGGYAK